MTPSQKSKSIIEQYENFDPSKHDIQDLLLMRKELAITRWKISNYCMQEEQRFKTIYQQRKVFEATTKLETDGTTQHRESTAIKEAEEMRIIEAQHDGNARGAKIVLDGIDKVLDSMASMINAMNRI